MTTLRRRLRTLAQYAPTQRYALVVALASVTWLASGTLVGETVAAAIAALVVLAGFIDALRIPGAAHVTFTRTLPTVLGLGEKGEGEYQISTPWPGTWRALVQHVPRAEVSIVLDPPTFTLTPRTVISRTVTVVSQQRGWHALGPVALVITGSLGLIRRTLVYYQDDTINIIPSTHQSRRFRLLAVQQRMRMAGSRVLKRRGIGTAFANLRDYAVGDDPRHIDWKATARHGRLVSREFTVEQGQTVMIAVDAGRMMTQMAGDRPRFEYALSAALTLADVALAAGDFVGLMVFNDELRHYIPPVRSPTTLMQIRDALTRSTATMVEPDYAAAFRTLATRHRRRSLIVILTDVIDTRSSRSIIANTVRSAQRHLPLVVALRNEQLVSASIPRESTDEGTGGDTSMGGYLNIAAEELLSARDEVLVHMRQAGVSVLDVLPTAMTPALINQYLEIKERGRL